IRSHIRLARGRIEEARADAAEALAGARPTQELQQLHTALATYARASFATGDRAAAVDAFQELVGRFKTEGTAQLSVSLPSGAAVAVPRHRARQFSEALPALGPETPWIAAARSYARGDLAEAAAIYREIGSLPDAAYASLRAAEARGGQGAEA